MSIDNLFSFYNQYKMNYFSSIEIAALHYRVE